MLESNPKTILVVGGSEESTWELPARGVSTCAVSVFQLEHAAAPDLPTSSSLLAPKPLTVSHLLVRNA